MMLMANGQMPTPRISPCCVWVRLNSAPHSLITNERITNPKAVATTAVKQPQNKSFSRAVCIGGVRMQSVGRERSVRSQKYAVGKPVSMWQGKLPDQQARYWRLRDSAP